MSSKITTIDLLRHGECEGGAILRGRTDSPLSPLGRQQMLDSIAALNNEQESNETSQRPWQQIIASPLQRCQRFANTLTQQENCSLRIDAGFQEIDFGDWDGQSIEGLEQHSSEAIAAFWQDPASNPPPQGETLKAFHSRVNHSWQALIQDGHAKHSLLITHGGVIKLILSELLQIPTTRLSSISVPHACLSRIQIFHREGSPDWSQLIFHRPLATPVLS